MTSSISEEVHGYVAILRGERYGSVVHKARTDEVRLRHESERHVQHQKTSLRRFDWRQPRLH